MIASNVAAVFEDFDPDDGARIHLVVEAEPVRLHTVCQEHAQQWEQSYDGQYRLRAFRADAWSECQNCNQGFPVSGATIHPLGKDRGIERNRELIRQHTVEFLRLGWRHQVSTDFRVPVADLATLAEALPVLFGPSWSGAPALLKLAAKLMRIELGREGSQVMYLHLPYWEHQEIGHDPTSTERRQYTAEQRWALLRQVVAFAGQTRADEVSISDRDGEVHWWAPGLVPAFEPVTVRLWWD